MSPIKTTPSYAGRTANLARRLKHHDRFCKMHTHEHYCSCGRDLALTELFALIENQQPAPTHELTLAQIRRRLMTACPKETTQ